MNEKQLYRHLSNVLEKTVPESTNLWPRIHHQVAANRPARRPALRIAWALAAALVLALSAVAVTAALSPLEKAASIIYGVDDIYQAGLYTEVNQSRQIGEVNVTVAWVYADPNLVMIAYSRESAANTNYASGADLASVIETSGIKLQPMEGAGYDSYMIRVYQMPPQLSAAEYLQVQLTFQGMRNPIPTIAPVTPTPLPVIQTDLSSIVMVPVTPMPLSELTGTTTVDVTIPITPGRIIEVGQEAQAEGLNMMVKQILLAPSSARADMCFDVPDAMNYEWVVLGKLSANFESVDGSSRGFISGQAHPCAQVLFEDQLTMNAAHYTLRMHEMVGFRLDAPGEQWRIAGPWVFEIDAAE